MDLQRDQEQLQKIFDKLPQALQDAIYSMETAQIIGDACAKYGIKDSRVSHIAGYTGDVLMGLLKPAELPKALEENVEMPKVLIEAISREISRFIFYPVKPELEQLHSETSTKEGKGLNIATPRHDDQQDQQTEQFEQEESSEEPQETKQKSTETDLYREPIE